MKDKDLEEFMDNREKRIAFAFMNLDYKNNKFNCRVKNPSLFVLSLLIFIYFIFFLVFSY